MILHPVDRDTTLFCFQFDYVIFTGDIPPHNVWNQSRSDQITAMETFTEYMLHYLPGKKVYGSLGNHESAPVNR